MKLIATTVIRNSPIGLETINGRILEIDWAKNVIARQMPVPLPKHPSSDDNPRGGLRGGRGVKRWGDQYYIANYDTVYVYDPDWTLRYEISHPLAIDIHEIDVDNEGVWLSCSKYDLIIKLNREGQLIHKWHISDSPSLMHELHINCDPIDYTRDYRVLAPKGLDNTHLNCIQIKSPNKMIAHLGHVDPEGIIRKIIRKLIGTPGPKAQNFSPFKRNFYEMLLGSRSYIIEIDLNRPEKPRILADYPALRPNHNGQLLSEDACVILAESHKVVSRKVSNPSHCNAIPLEGTWFRGLAKVNDERILVGIAPCAIIEVDIASRQALRKMSLSNDPNEAIHGLAVVG